MKLLGIGLIVLGSLLALIAFATETSVATGLASSSIAGGTFPSEVANLSLMQRQIMLLQTGLACFVAGCVFTGAGHVADAISGLKRPTTGGGEALPNFGPSPNAPENSRITRPETGSPLEGESATAANEPEPSDYSGVAIGVALVLVFGFILAYALLAGEQSSNSASIVANYNDEELMANDTTSAANAL
jgi:hypothetical protein